MSNGSVRPLSSGICSKLGPQELLFHSTATIGMLYLAAVSMSQPPMPMPPSPITVITCLPGRANCAPMAMPMPCPTGASGPASTIWPGNRTVHQWLM